MNVPNTKDRAKSRPILVYWHCDTWWSLKEGPVCPMEHDMPLYDDRLRKGRKRRVWVCKNGSGDIAYLSRQAYLEHDEEYCGY